MTGNIDKSTGEKRDNREIVGNEGETISGRKFENTLRGAQSTTTGLQCSEVGRLAAINFFTVSCLAIAKVNMFITYCISR